MYLSPTRIGVRNPWRIVVVCESFVGDKLLRRSVELLGRWRGKVSLLVCLAMYCFGCPAAFGETGVYSLDNAAIAVKTPMATPLVAIARVGQRLVAAGLHGVIVVSSDSGVTWRQASVPVDVTLTAIYFISPQEGWAVGHFGVILHTGDGGLTWTRVVDGLDVIKALNATAALAQSTAQWKSSSGSADLKWHRLRRREICGGG